MAPRWARRRYTEWRHLQPKPAESRIYQQLVRGVAPSAARAASSRNEIGRGVLLSASAVAAAALGAGMACSLGLRRIMRPSASASAAAARARRRAARHGGRDDDACRGRGRLAAEASSVFQRRR